MADNFKVLDVRADELQANLNSVTEPWLVLHWDFYWKGEERRATLVMVRTQPPTVAMPPGFDPRKLRPN